MAIFNSYVKLPEGKFKGKSTPETIFVFTSKYQAKGFPVIFFSHHPIL